MRSRLREALRCLASKLGVEAGQATVEYALVTVLLLGIVAFVPMPTPPMVGGSKTLVQLLFVALQRYVDFWIYCLNVGF